ncbi:hypothetical protein ES703_23506 [subsurface metagenome]
MNKIDLHDCKFHLVPFSTLKMASTQVIKKKAFCSKCKKVFELTYLLDSIKFLYY